ncbi:TRAP transporter small permease subunit [Hyphococcus formosus]|uniref:TRAP transporter small permease subunit n=1 Tax=Hyphococcus formosus TaxID=3143534 RepID=UPI00398B9836
MLNLIGDILNWVAAGILFPVLFIPLARLLGGKTATWIATVTAVVLIGIAFAYLVPILRVVPSPNQLIVFGSCFAFLSSVIQISGGLEKFSDRTVTAAEKFVRGTGNLVMWLLIIMALVQFGIVVLRYVFGINKIYMQESITYLHGTVFMLAGGYALLTNDHVRVDIFYGEAPEKRKALIDFLGTYFLLFPVCLLLLWTASPYVGNSWAVSEGSPQGSGIHAVFLLKSLIPAFALLMILAGFSIASRAAETLKGLR